VLPILSIEGERRFGVWTIAADVAYGTVGSDRWLFDIEACVGIQITDNLTFDLGYRYWKKSFDETTNHAELEASGPFLALMLRF
jgi:opacity protein-like surface antigen